MDATANITGSIINKPNGNQTGCPTYHDESGPGTDEVVLIFFISICMAIFLYLCGCMRGAAHTEGVIGCILRNKTPAEVDEMLAGFRRNHRRDPCCWGLCYGSAGRCGGFGPPEMLFGE